jgi:hypothetical protein
MAFSEALEAIGMRFGGRVPPSKATALLAWASLIPQRSLDATCRDALGGYLTQEGMDMVMVFRERHDLGESVADILPAKAAAPGGRRL